LVVWEWPVWGSVLVVGLGPSVVAALVEPFAVGGVGERVRVVGVVVVCAVLGVVVRGRRWLSAGLGVVGVVVVWWNSVVGVWEGPDVGPELWTLPTAAALGGIMLLMVWALQRPVPSLLTFGPPLTVALIPSALAAVSDLTEPDAGLWRIAAVLLTGSACVAVGALTQRAGILLPGLVALVIVVLPVASRLAVAFDAWIPLSIAGLLLLVVGARLEHVRKQGRAVATWITRLR
jgi:hypothetical protein